MLIKEAFIILQKPLENQTTTKTVLQLFCGHLGVLKLPTWPCSGLTYVRFEDIFYDAESQNSGKINLIALTALHDAHWSFIDDI